jgi:hypothetical protein
MKRFMMIALIGASLSACVQEGKEPRPQEFKAMKYCIDNCLWAKFQMFHAEGHSWGTGSSSMSGLGQERIYDRVLAYCKEFYSDEKCCEGDAGVTWRNINTIHGFRYGACI